MNQHWQYAKYVCRHKWYVFVECCKLGIPLAGLTHDLSKLLPDEWGPYAASFYGPQYPKIADIFGDARNRAFDSGHFKERVRGAFDVAWLNHQHRNPHHWQHWVLREDSGKVKVLRMPERYMREMLADWRGAGRSIPKADDTATWYAKNSPNILLHHETRAWIEGQLGVTVGLVAH